MLISILTLFPEMFDGPLGQSIISRARKKDKVRINLVNIRDYATDSYKTVDDRPYGGGLGMILKVDVVDAGLRRILAGSGVVRSDTRVILLDPQGKRFRQRDAVRLAGYRHLVLIAGHYEGVDDRIRKLSDEEISVGDYVLTGGELPAMVITDSVIRLLPGVLREVKTTSSESFSDPKILEYPQFTRPPDYRGMKVPEILLSGNHARIAAWRNRKARSVTRSKRPDLNRRSSK
ncbi:tRNA (guanosine(37)-N1)-methyltransferase TrmD [Candidatus Gottesmanbacteria bacterium RBG_16_52_11]|uniref:tRNA (guanine-N(1)-)-methyltransferase n=1 Tax=Candidatus Gottesmanbacteria bacterium RBG_16_52_11 TaxID=1798374 RepID=A0A1F5YNV6_9BACT|nr:MAG: tRNA (guanosine(37)-N1)-methyltransferase TrmD [Candidatus Gottesmanbacteria bacterium RBG_16_52_11]